MVGIIKKKSKIKIIKYVCNLCKKEIIVETDMYATYEGAQKICMDCKAKKNLSRLN